MNKDQAFAFRKRWNELLRIKKDVEHRIAILCLSMRNACKSDDDFIRWCGIELGQSDVEAHRMLLQADAVRILPDASQWERAGNLNHIAKIATLPKREQVAVLQQSKLQGRKVISIMRERNLITPIKPAAIPAQVKKRISDVALLAKYIAEHLPNARLPSDVQTIVLMYVPSFGRKRAA